MAEPEKTIKPEIGDRFTPVHGACAPAWAKFEREPARTTRRTFVLRKTFRLIIEAPEAKPTFILCKCQKKK
ncbi:hypothetical protein [Stutzerimonas stutzeri]|uniref:hypothetical protein n=1 Tax=Stutzerimonas TaxID=2901164 RepID=UPI001BB09B12|nr:hypothetical protein [Stutzerimonas stutzeri]QUE76814.1 hypothetical protein KCX70_04380 [Stutzerimonas stutzeri]